jgi:hypothetical protein
MWPRVPGASLARHSMMRWAGLLLVITACWTGRSVSEPPGWRSAPVSALLPDGAWLVAALDLDASGPEQQAKEARARRDPDAVHTDDGSCQIPGTHVAFAVYANDSFAAAVRGVFRRTALLDCIAQMARAKDQAVARTFRDGLEVLAISSSSGDGYRFTASDTVAFLAGTDQILRRAMAGDTRPATADPSLRPLIDSARKGGELWVAALLPRDSKAVRNVLSLLSVTLEGRVVSLTGSIHITPPFQIDLVIVLEREGDAKRLVDGLTRTGLRFKEVGGDSLAILLDALEVRADGDRVRITGRPQKIEWMQLVEAIPAAIGRLDATQ